MRADYRTAAEKAAARLRLAQLERITAVAAVSAIEKSGDALRLRRAREALQQLDSRIAAFEASLARAEARRHVDGAQTRTH